MTAAAAQAPSGAAQRIVVIGAGVVGVCVALYLQRDGHAVTLVDRQGPGEGASFGNGAVIGEESVVPVAMPGILGKVPGMLLDPLGPLAIRWSYLPRLAPWLLRFVAASRPAEVERISIALKALMDGAFDAFKPLLELAGAEAMLKRGGWVGVYETEDHFAAAQPYLEVQRRRGVALDVLPPEELRQLEPALAPGFHRGVYYPKVGHTVNNFRLVQELAAAFTREGGTLCRQEVRGFDFAGGGGAGPSAVVTEAGPLPCDAVVLAAGAWSRGLARQLGENPPLDTERGYHMHLPNPGVAPRIPVYSTTYGFVSTPLEHGLRLAGTVELGGLEAAPNWKRAEVLLTHARRFFPELDTREAEPWMGHRPSMPDSLPVISRGRRHRKAFFAFGHGHCGLMLSARSGKLIADLVAGRDPGMDLAPYRVDRF